MKRRILFLIAVSLTIISGLAFWQLKPAEGKSSFWVITEKSNSDGMNYQLELAINELKEKYPDLEIMVEVLPTETSEREIRLQQIRTQIMAGKGPDVYLLPTGDLLTTDDPAKGTTIKITPLFADVNQAMRNGLFADISSCYDNDEELNPTALNQTVMDAGCVGKNRYVLPLRYSMPVIYVSSDTKVDISQMTAQAIVTSFLDTEDREIAFNADISNPLDTLPQLLDYDNAALLVSTDELETCLQLYQNWTAKAEPYLSQLIQDGNIRAVQSQDPDLQTMMSEDYYHITYDSFGRLWSMLGIDIYWKSSGLPIYTGNLGNVMDNVAASKALNEDITTVPFRASDGSIFAEVTYYGAVGRDTNDLDAAYELLSCFLSEEYQWDINRPRRDASAKTGIYGKIDDPQSKGMVENSWPVRTVGAVAPLWDNYRYQMKGLMNPYVDGLMRASKRLQNKDFILTDADFPVFSWEIDFVRFPIVEPAIDDLLESMNLGDLSVTETAERVKEILWWHLTEG